MNNDKAKLVRIGIEILIIAFCVGVAWATYNGKVSYTETIAKEAKVKADSNELAIVELKTDVKHIKETVDRIEKKL